MLGHPKYHYGDTIAFKIDNQEKIGTIYIIDEYGTFEQNEDVSYDILVKDEYDVTGEKRDVLYKHVKENVLMRLIKPAEDSCDSCRI